MSILTELQEELIGKFFGGNKQSMTLSVRINTDNFISLLDQTIAENRPYIKGKPTSFKEIKSMMFPIVGNVNIVLDDFEPHYTIVYE